MVRTSPGVVAAMLRFYERLSAKDVASFDSLVSPDPATLVIGTAPGEWVTERARLRFGFEAEGLAIDAGPSPKGWENGDTGWFTDEPTYVFPGGAGRMRTRLTSILQREDGAWRIVHMHVSVGVPDDEVLGLQARWDGTAVSEGEALDLGGAWARTEAALADGWTLDSLRCASTGLRPEQRSDDWVAIALGPGGEQRASRASDPFAALEGLAPPGR